VLYLYTIIIKTNNMNSKTKNITLLIAIALTVLSFQVKAQTVLGCTYSGYQNYNPLATVDDGSCIPHIYGCLDLTAMNYYVAVSVHVQSSCCYVAWGCTESTASNYDSLACSDNGTCIAGGTICESVVGFETTATIRITSPTKDLFTSERLVVEYRETGTTGVWVTSTLVLDPDLVVNNTIDTLGVQFWHFNDVAGSPSTGITSVGNRFRSYVRLNNLSPNTGYDVKVYYEGVSSLSSVTDTRTNVVARSFWTQGVYESQTHPY
jgi:hypothetical protein